MAEWGCVFDSANSRDGGRECETRDIEDEMEQKQLGDTEEAEG